MRIKKYKQNEYIYNELWIRNPFIISSPLDINNLISSDDETTMLSNEVKNINQRYPYFDFNSVTIKNMIIVSDGYDYINLQKNLLGIDHKTVIIVGVNGALKNWKMCGNHLPAKDKRIMHYYLINNPYDECVNYIPNTHRYFPTTIASSRTSNDFLRKYEGLKYLYNPICNENFSGRERELDVLDDYRNPITAAISFGVKCGLEKLVLFCCDDSFKNERPGSIRLENGLYCYPQQIKAQRIIDGCLYWLKKYNISVKDCSNGIKYDNAEHIYSQEVKSFFED